MLDMKFVRDNLARVQENLDARHTDGNLSEYATLYDERKELIQKGEELKALRNAVTAEISVLKREQKTLMKKYKKCRKWEKKLHLLMQKFVLSKNR